ncbi:flagellar basal body-associated FliL family protein [Radiobacillus kanasensis]|uniref:flagellar basal body-associated FliL family protein n=1 Tax=Radiobacillus kanasensis TaxID=2844358 RepID=UPI001E5B668A|nr:flagellar basal body-associated FliL family protein [Radiobacillus kanasensis]UFU01032.1 flagellar basal body-associated FliL family protein [Radiobacillus kanasensis]
MNRKFITILISILVVLTIVGAVAVVVVLNLTGEKEEEKVKELTADELLEYSFEAPEVTTDLSDGSYLKIQYQVVGDSKEAKEEIEKRSFQMKNIMIKQLSPMSADEIQNDLAKIEEKMVVELNKVMEEGKIVDVYTISKVLQ